MGIALASCLPAPAGPEVELALELPEGLSSEGLSFEVHALRSPARDAVRCEELAADPTGLTVPPGTPFVRFQPRGDEAQQPLLPDLGFGEVRVYVRARDTECRLRAAGCVDAEVRRSGPDRVAVPLAAPDEAEGCPEGDRCLGFVCTSEACVGSEEPRDEDGDGAFVCTPSPADVEDCDDGDPSRSPFAPEICNEIDDDCDGVVDEDLEERTYYADADGDGYGDPMTGKRACAPPAGHVTRGDDCDDADADIFPGAPLRCSGADDDCDGTVDPSPAITAFPDEDGDGFGRQGSAGETVCGMVPEGLSRSSDDCDDADPDRHPDATEMCNDVDDDCDGVVDEDVGTFDFYEDADGDGWGAGPAMTACAPPGPGWVTRAGDCRPDDPNFHPGARDQCATLADEGCGRAAEPVGDGVSPTHSLYPYYRWFEETIIGPGNLDRSAPIDDAVFEAWVHDLAGCSPTCFTRNEGDVTRARALFCVRAGAECRRPSSTSEYPCDCNDITDEGAQSLDVVKAAVCWADGRNGAYGRRIIHHGSCNPSNPNSCCPGRLLNQSAAAIILFNAFGPEQTVCEP